MDSAKNLRKLPTVFARHPVVCAYLFGSRASGRARPSSDTDIAALLSPRLPEARRRRARFELLGEICSALQTDAVDLVILNDAPPALAFEATSSGRTLYCRDELARIRFEARAMSFYYDRLPGDRRSAEIMLDRTARRGLP